MNRQQEFRKQTEEAKLEAFSLMCKKVAELEQENTTLWTMVKEKDKQISEFEKLPRKVKELEAEVKEWKDKADLWCKTANLKDHNIMINKELEKENAELKERNRGLDAMLTGESLISNERKEQLTKAKELLERFLGLGNLWDLDCKDYFPLRKEAEQFLSEVEK